MKARAVFPFTWVPKRIAVAMPTKKGKKERQTDRKTERKRKRNACFFDQFFLHV